MVVTSQKNKQDHVVHAIVFSKDRAFQLEQLLKSLKLNTDLVHISVLYTASTAVVDADTTEEVEDLTSCSLKSYLEVSELYPDVYFLQEEVMY